jgi:hypothetical protein
MNKSLVLIIGTAMLGFASCSKNAANDIQPAGSSSSAASLARHGADDAGLDDRGGNGNDDSTGHTSNDDNTEIIKNFRLGNSSLKSSRTDSMQIVLRKAAPAGGYTAAISSNDAAVRVPATVTIAAGATTKWVVLSTTIVKSSRKVTVQATINGQSESDSFNLLP